MKFKFLNLTRCFSTGTIFFAIVMNFLAISTIAQNRIVVQNQKYVEINLYRGIIELNQSQTDEFIIEGKLYDFDKYEDSGSQIEVATNFDLQSVEINGDSLIYNSPTTSNLVKLRISVPMGINLHLRIAEYGIMEFSDLNNTITAEIYQGKMSGTINTSISAHIVRDGEFDFNLKPSKAKRYVLLSGYRVALNLAFPKNNGATVDIVTDLAAIHNSLDLNFDQSQGESFNVIDSKTRIKTKEFQKCYKGQMGSGKDVVKLRTVKGTINLAYFK